MERNLELPDGRTVIISSVVMNDQQPYPSDACKQMQQMRAGEVYISTQGGEPSMHIVANDDQGQPGANVLVIELWHEHDGLIEGAAQVARYIGFTKTGPQGHLVHMGLKGLKLEAPEPLMPMPVGPEITDETPLDDDTLSRFALPLASVYAEENRGKGLECREAFASFIERMTSRHDTVGSLKQELGL